MEDSVKSVYRKKMYLPRAILTIARSRVQSTQPAAGNFGGAKCTAAQKEGVRRCVAAPRSCTPPLDSPHRKKAHFRALRQKNALFCASGISIVGTGSPMEMVLKLFF